MNIRAPLFLLCGAVAVTAIVVGVFSDVEAQSSIAENITITYPIDSDYATGDIIVRDQDTNALQPAARPDASNMFGVVAEQPLVVFQIEEGNVPVVRSGQAEVNVTIEGGAISVGDPITSSSVQGYGRKANRDDVYQVGTALESFAGDVAGQGDGGNILVDVKIGRIDRFFEDDEEATEEDGLLTSMGFFETMRLDLVTRYLIAALIAIAAIFGSFRYFGSNLSAGITSIGRNPLAKNSIKRMMFINIIAIVIISLAGVALSVFILLLPVPGV